MNKITFTGYNWQEITIYGDLFEDYLQEHKTITLTYSNEFPDTIGKINDELYLLRILTYTCEVPECDYVEELWVVASKEELQRLYKKYKQLSFVGFAIFG